jgi:hypothetical protein
MGISRKPPAITGGDARISEILNDSIITCNAKENAPSGRKSRGYSVRFAVLIAWESLHGARL